MSLRLSLLGAVAVALGTALPVRSLVGTNK